jgi:hypothetical protein
MNNSLFSNNTSDEEWTPDMERQIRKINKIRKTTNKTIRKRKLSKSDQKNKNRNPNRNQNKNQNKHKNTKSPNKTPPNSIVSKPNISKLGIHNPKIPNPNIPKKTRYRKKNIPKAFREQVWKRYNGDIYEANCYVEWCHNSTNTFNFHVGHDIPESKGGEMSIENLRPICSNCNLSMGNRFTIREWEKKGNPYNRHYWSIMIVRLLLLCFVGYLIIKEITISR